MDNRLYEAMFLVDATIGDEGIPEVVKHINQLIKRFDGKLERVEKWDERELVYPVERVNFGIYLLSYFSIDSGKVNDLRRLFNLSEQLVRFVLLKTDDLPPAAGTFYDENGQVVEQPLAESDEETSGSDQEVAGEAEDNEEGDTVSEVEDI